MTYQYMEETRHTPQGKEARAVFIARTSRWEGNWVRLPRNGDRNCVRASMKEAMFYMGPIQRRRALAAVPGPRDRRLLVQALEAGDIPTAEDRLQAGWEDDPAWNA